MSFNLKYINIFNDINTSNKQDIQDFYRIADVKVDGNFQPPSFNESTELQRTMQGLDINSPESICKHLCRYTGANNIVAEELSKDLISGLSIIVPSKTAIQSTYGKVTYWLAKYFSRALDGNEHNIYVKANIQKHELYTLYMLSKLGNNIVVIDYNINTSLCKPYNNMLLNMSDTTDRLELTDNIDISFDDIIKVLNGTKEYVSGRVIIIGEDNKGELNRALIDIADRNPSNIMILKFGMIKPSFDEVNSVPRINAASVDQLIKRIGPHMFRNKSGESERASIFIKEFIKNNYTSENKAEQALISFICLYNRYNLDYDVLVSYGKLDTISDTYTKFLKYIGKMVVVVDTADKSRLAINTSLWTEIRLDDIIDQHKYPDVLNSNTVAFNAQTEINQMLYNGDTLGMYRDRQYKTCDIAMLKSTFDEMIILWKQDNTVRPSFESTSTSVIVPVLYSKLFGCSKDYVTDLRRFVTEHTIICYKPSDIMLDWQQSMTINHFADINGTLFKEQKPMYKAGKLDINCIMQYKTFTYRFLETGVQMHILSKIDQLITENWIAHPGVDENDFVDLVLNIGLNLSKRIQQEMQWYDFTKQSPKLILLCQDEEELTIGQSIVLTLLHLCGWDIIIAIPTCYNVLGKYLRQDALQEHSIGEPRFDTSITCLEPLPEEKKKRGFFSFFK